MRLSGLFKYLTPSYWKGTSEKIQPRKEPLTIDNVSQDSLLLYLSSLGASDEHLITTTAMFGLLEKKGFKNLIPRLAGAYSLMFKTISPSTDHLKAFTAFVVASAEHIELTKSEIYNAAALFVIKIKEGIPAKDIPEIILHEICAKASKSRA